MRFDISREELVAGTRLAVAPASSLEPSGDLRAWLRRAEVANVTTDPPDAIAFVKLFGPQLLQALRAKNMCDELYRCVTRVSPDEYEFFLPMCSPVLSASDWKQLEGAWKEQGISLYCLLDTRQLMASHIANGGFHILSKFPSLPCPGKPCDVEEIRASYFLHDLADDLDVLSAIFAEWVFGRPKSMVARDFICQICRNTVSGDA